jgi:hypothetical protein
MPTAKRNIQPKPISLVRLTTSHRLMETLKLAPYPEPPKPDRSHGKKTVTSKQAAVTAWSLGTGPEWDGP